MKWKKMAEKLERQNSPNSCILTSKTSSNHNHHRNPYNDVQTNRALWGQIPFPYSHSFLLMSNSET